MDFKNKIKTWWSKLTVKTINTTFGIIVFVLVFLFTFLYGFQFKDDWKILLAVFGSLILAAGIAWLVLALLVSKRRKLSDPNQQKISEALKRVEEQNKEDTESNI